MRPVRNGKRAPPVRPGVGRGHDDAEGGLDEKEIELAQDYKFLPVSFGDNRLRTETAAISAASYINLVRI